MQNNLPIYKIKVNENDSSGVFAVSLVDEPAIEVDWIKLSKEILDFEFSANKDKQLLYGALLIPNKLIFRRDEKGNEFNIVFDEETIEIIANKFNENKLNDQFNFQHSNRKVEAVILENWLTGETDKSSEYGYNLPKGTWFAKVKVKDENFWLNEIKSEKVKGFSVEIKCDIELLQLNNNKIKINFMEIKTNEGVSLYYDGELGVGTSVFLDESMTEKAPEGAHMLEDTRVITVDSEGVIVAIAEETPEIPVEVVEEELNQENLQVNPDEVMVIIQPALDMLNNQIAELTNKVLELESKLDELKGEENNVEELRKEINEKLSSISVVDSITKLKDSKVNKKNDELSLRINSLRNIIR